MAEYYVLDGKTAVPTTMETWSRSYNGNRRVARTELDDATVSTVFLGLNHQYGDGPPLIFETMVFGGTFDQWQDRCSTWEEAEAMHEKAVAFCKEGVGP